LLEIIPPSPEHGDNDARELVAYYRPFDLRLRLQLGLACLPWEA
jgi:hypothetical protein